MHWGYSVGSVDGVMGPQTAEAIRKYQKRHDLLVDGRPTQEMAQHIQAQGVAAEGA